MEETVRRAKPAVVCLKSLDSLGSGFFVTDTGIVATNAHVARGGASLLALLPSGVQLQAKVVYIDADLDIALVKVAPPSSNFVFPLLPLADLSSIRQGDAVLAIGSPGDAMLFSVTKGIVSAVGKFASAGLALGSRPTLPSTRAIPAARFSIPAAKSSASTPRNSSRKMSPESALLSAPPTSSLSFTVSIPLFPFPLPPQPSRRATLPMPRTLQSCRPPEPRRFLNPRSRFPPRLLRPRFWPTHHYLRSRCRRSLRRRQICRQYARDLETPAGPHLFLFKSPNRRITPVPSKCPSPPN